MNDLQQMLEDSVNRLFSDQLDWDALTRIEQTGFPESLWQQVVDQGTALVMAGETAGGLDGGWADAYPVLRACGRHAVPLPVAETMLAHYLARDAGVLLPDGVAGLIIDGRASRADDALVLADAVVPWGRRADYLLAHVDGAIVVADPAGLDIAEHDNIGLDPRDCLIGRVAAGQSAPTSLPADALRHLGALMRAAQIAGGAAACLDLAVQYAGEREQFGRALSKFQAIQHYLADLAGNVASIDAMAMAACAAVDARGVDGARLEIAAAKCRASEGVEKVTKLAHQIHGAIGFTYEYGLHFVTRRLWAWRAEFGGTAAWGEVLGRFAVEAGGDGIWPAMTG